MFGRSRPQHGENHEESRATAVALMEQFVTTAKVMVTRDALTRVAAARQARRVHRTLG
jgi:hypothetical protein